MPPLTAILAERARRQTLAAQLEVEHHEDAVRARCKTLAGFIREAWHVLEPSTRYVHGWVIDALCAHLEAITFGKFLELGLENRIAANVPPGTMKSLIFGVFWPAWEWGPCEMPWLRYLTTSWNEDYATRDARKHRDLVASNWYQSLWGDTVRLNRAGESSFDNTAGGGREAMAFVSLTGGRGDRVIWDDPHSTEKAESDSERQRTIRVFRESLTLRLNDPVKSAILGVMQRLNDGDVCGVIDRLKLGYTRIIYPMEFEVDRRCVTPFYTDPRTTEGELLFPERFPREVVERDKIPLGSYGVAGQFQQRPSPRGGGSFKRHWFEVVSAAPADCKTCRGWDLAGTKSKTAAFTAGCKLSRAPNNIFYIEDMVRLRGSPAEVENAIVSTASQDGKDVEISLPQDPGQAGKMQAAYLVSKLAGYKAYTSPESGDKEQRAQPVSAQAEAGNVKLVAGPWNEAFLEEAALFPNSDYLDQIDALSRAFGRLLQKPSSTFVVPIITATPRDYGTGT